METSCPICLTPIPEEKINILSCGHKICSECILKFIEFNNKCPICNSPFMNYTSKIDNKLHELTKDNLSNINKKKKEFELNENFECITIEDIEQQIKYVKSKADYLYNKLFGPRNENGSDKEKDMILNMYENINKIKEMINDDEEINFKKINKIIDTMINDIKKVETREYKNYIEEVDNGMQFDIEYCTKKKGKKKKHK
jgi:hypothetical protein